MIGGGGIAGNVTADLLDTVSAIPMGLFEAGRLTWVRVFCKCAGSESGNNVLATTEVDGDR